ncbi:hypothetical protein F5Y11DRAFT_82100 [Daldinia sp. FL1419]|nr:hypothetical protein F5Y11DRAFT_82100 [Daldinia sp. FL1419]
MFHHDYLQYSDLSNTGKKKGYKRGPAKEKTRGAAKKQILEHPWWSLAEFCPFQKDAMRLELSRYVQDVTAIRLISNANVQRARSWCYAMINHSPYAGRYDRVLWARLPFLVHEDGGCLSKPDDVSRMDEVVSQMETDGICRGCTELLDPTESFAASNLPKHPYTGLIYPHFGDGRVEKQGAEKKTDNANEHEDTAIEDAN